MKRKLIIISSFILIIILIIIGILINKKNNILLNNYLNNGSNLAFYYETETGEYTLGESFTSLDGFYSLNTSRSSCDNGLDTIEWDNTNKRVIMSSGKSNRCKLYFDINKRFTLLSYYPITGRDAQITNLIKNGDYEEGDNYWTINNSSITTEKYSHGNNSLKHNSGNFHADALQSLGEKPINNHSYYGRLKFLSNSNFNVNDDRYDWWGQSDILEQSDLVFVHKNIEANDWTLLSGITTLKSAEHLSKTWIIRNFLVNPSQISYSDELMMIDLTQSYGENIPSKEELDNELMYFDGTVDIKSVTGRNGVFTVPNLPEVTQIECNNGGKAIVSGNTVTITGDSSQTTCYLKKTMIGSLLQSDPGEQGVLLKHTPKLPNSAGDDGYRYSGNQPNNYICFGLGSEDYNNGTTDECPLQNKYRVIGYVPVAVNGKQENHIKIIKAEYLTEKEFETQDTSPYNTSSFVSDYDYLKRVETTEPSVAGYHWNDTADNTWENSSLYNSLNSEEYLNKAFGKTWQNKIETVTWNVGGNNASNIIPAKMYQAEMTGQGATAKVNNLIGLMYLYDFGFASSQNNWNKALIYYNNMSGGNNRENNWLYNAVTEWTISRWSESTNICIYIVSSGFAHWDARFGIDVFAHATRPVFYLKETVNIKDSDANGSREHPFRITI